MIPNQIPSWKKAPFLRLLIPLVLGVALEWHFNFSVTILTALTVFCLIVLCLISFLKTKWIFTFGWMLGILVNTFILAASGIIGYYKNGEHRPDWVGHYYQKNQQVLVTLQEPLSEKTKTYKAIAAVNAVTVNNSWQPVSGNIIIYFKKDDSLQNLQYGSQIIINTPLQTIQNSGNPGAFDYKRYCAFNNIYYQAFLKNGDYTILQSSNKNIFKQFLFDVQHWVLQILRKYIKDNKVLGLAEALLIGYKDELDKALVQSYTNTGVVHIIAISGLHLGLIYWLLALLCKPLQKIRFGKWLYPIIIIASLWIFSLLTGGSPSVIRSAVMFTCLVIGETGERRTSILNSLAASAFLLLCYNPYWLWDVGFQLSYAAVLSLVIFMQPIYNLLSINNKLLDALWKLNAVTIAAQILTLPISIYHFHQFPNYFLLTNLVAVPLSSLIVLGEIFLCAMAFIQPFANLIGKLVSILIKIMNGFIEYMERLPFSLWDNLYISFTQFVFLMILIIALGFWLMEKTKTFAVMALAALLCFFVVRTVNIINTKKQNKLIVYNVPQHQAIDIIEGQYATFIGDSILLENDFLQNFHLKPARILQRVMVNEYAVHQPNCLLQIDKGIVLADGITNLPDTLKNIDVIIFSHLQKIKMSFQLLQHIHPKIVVTDATVSGYKLKQLQLYCANNHIPIHIVQQQGAYELNLNDKIFAN